MKKRKSQGVPPQSFLQDHLVCVREIPNGYDFIFGTVSPELHAAVREFISAKVSLEKSITFAHAQLQDSLLLRVTGPDDRKSVIRDWFHRGGK